MRGPEQQAHRSYEGNFDLGWGSCAAGLHCWNRRARAKRGYIRAPGDTKRKTLEHQLVSAPTPH
jgi:hypothetical protein